MTLAFQLTRPVWGEPFEFETAGAGAANFNSLAPCGANRIHQKLFGASAKFQLTRPVWGEPAVNENGEYIENISTHSPRVGRTKEARTWL